MPVDDCRRGRAASPALLILIILMPLHQMNGSDRNRSVSGNVCSAIVVLQE